VITNQSLLKVIGLVMLSHLIGGCLAEPAPIPTPTLEVQRSALDPESGISSSLPVIDGSIQEEEWNGADVWALEDGGQLYLILTEDHLYLALRTLPQGMIAGNVFLFSGDQIRVLHTSAALGTAVYQPDGGQWLKVKDFEWCCRSRIADQDSLEDRQAFSDKDGWLGANSFLGIENELEYGIRLGETETALAVNYLWVDEVDVKQVWPAGLTDGVAWPSLGGFPDRMEFSPTDWYALSGAD